MSEEDAGREVITMAHIEHSSRGFERQREGKRDTGHHERSSKDTRPDSADRGRDE
jgi:hypothetical protein